MGDSMKKNIMLLIICIFLTGCSVDYNLIVNEDLSINEQINASETEAYFDKEYTYYERKEAIDNLWENMTSVYDKKYTYTYNSNDTGVIVNNNYNSIEEYIDSKLYKQYFENVEYEKNGNKVIIKSTGEFYPYTTQDFEKFPINDFKLNIKVPFKVVKNNADSVEGNIYTWKIDSKTKDKSLYLEFDTSKNYTNSSRAIDFKIIFGIILVVSIIGIYIYYNIKKNDSLI